MTKKECWLVIVGVICVVGLAQLACMIPYSAEIVGPVFSAAGGSGGLASLLLVGLYCLADDV